MKQFLIDVNVLIALFDQKHEFHEECLYWVEKIKFNIVICPIVENGMIRICTHNNYPNGASTFSECLAFLRDIRTLTHPKFIKDSFSFSFESKSKQDELLIPSKHVTDIYLINLAKSEDYFFATFDNRIPKSLLRGCENTIKIISH